MRKIVSRLRGSLCRLLTLLFFVSIATSSAAQAKAKKQVQYPCNELIAGGMFDQAEAEIQKLLAEPEPDASAFYAAYVLFATPEFAQYDINTAYDYLDRGRTAFIKANGGKKEKLKGKGYSTTVFAKAFAQLSRAALDTATALNTIDGYNHYLDTYPRFPKADKKQATIQRDTLAFIFAVKDSTVAAFDTFLVHYPKAREFKVATAMRNALAYSHFDSIGTVRAYQDFINKYPRADEVSVAMEHLFLFAYDEAKRIDPDYPRPKIQLDSLSIRKESLEKFVELTKLHKWEKFKKYIENHPNDKVINALAQIEIWSIVNRNQDLEGLRFCIDRMRTSMRDSCLLTLHKAYERADDIKSFYGFYHKYDSLINCEKLKRLREKDKAAMLARDSCSTEDFIRAAAPYNCAFVALRKLVDPLIKSEKWTEAQKTIKQFAKAFGNDYRYRNLLRITKPVLDKSIKVKSIGDSVNTKFGGEYAAVVTADSKKIYITGTHRLDNKGGEDIFISKKVDGEWSSAKLVKEISSAKGNESVESVSTDGTQMIVFKDGKETITIKGRKGWGPLKKMSDKVNFCGWQADAIISSDGRALLHAASKATPHELSGGRSIYVHEMQADGTWGEAYDLGPTINQSFCTRAPFLHPDMRTLYFCSDGHGGLGKLDVFMSKRLRDDSWTEWSEPINLGREINTVGSDCWYVISTEGDVAYFSSNENGSNDIFSVNLPKDVKPDPVTTISGRLTDENGNAVSATLRWEDLDLHIVVGQSRTDPEDGSFFIVLPLGRNYGYFIEDPKYFPLSQNIDLRNEHKFQHIENDLSIASMKSMLTDSVPMSLNNLFFNVGDSTLLPTSISELKRVAQLINKVRRPVEISGHTDDTGDNVRNQRLSEARAREVMAFLISEGCDPSLLRAVGYGKTRPKASNKTEDGRRKNRRVDIRFINKINKK